MEIDSLKGALGELKVVSVGESKDTNKFSFNPPSIVKALVESKTAEISLKTKLKKVLQNE